MISSPKGTCLKIMSSGCSLAGLAKMKLYEIRVFFFSCKDNVPVIKKKIRVLYGNLSVISSFMLLSIIMIHESISIHFLGARGT